MFFWRAFLHNALYRTDDDRLFVLLVWILSRGIKVLCHVGKGETLTTGVQPADIGLPTGNGKTLSCSQAQVGQVIGLAVA